MGDGSTCSCSCECGKRHYTGTTLKIVVSPSAEGFDASSDNWYVEVYYGSQNMLYKTFEKDDLIDDGEGRYIAVVDTRGIVGDIRVRVVAEIPDDDCEGGIRYEVGRCYVCKVES